MLKNRIPTLHGRQWGEWQFDERRLYLDNCQVSHNISIQTEKLALQIFANLRHVATKSWASKGSLVNLLLAHKEIFSSCGKFSKAYGSEVAVHKVPWEQFCSEIEGVIQTDRADRQRWNLMLQGAYDRFIIGRDQERSGRIGLGASERPFEG